MRQQYLYSLTDEFLGQPSRYALTAQAHRAHCQQHNQSQTGMFTHVKENKINTTITTPVSQPLSQDNVGKPAYQKGKTSLDLNEARDDGVWGCIGISLTTCKQSAPCSRQKPHQHLITLVVSIEHQLVTLRHRTIASNLKLTCFESLYISFLVILVTLVTFEDQLLIQLSLFNSPHSRMSRNWYRKYSLTRTQPFCLCGCWNHTSFT